MEIRAVSNEELWDAYDRDRRPTGEVLRRGGPIPPGHYHLVAEVLLRRTDGQYLLMRRAPDKPFCPGMWEASAGGSALLGEASEPAARREVREETGLICTHLRLLYQEVGDSYLFDYYLADTEGGIVTLQPGETTDFRWVSPGRLRAMIAAGQVMHARMLRGLEERFL